MMEKEDLESSTTSLLAAVLCISELPELVDILCLVVYSVLDHF